MNMKDKLHALENTYRAKLAIEHELEQMLALNNREKEKLGIAIEDARNAIQGKGLRKSKNSVESC